MWRSLFLALGAFTCILGVECLMIDKAVLKLSQQGGPGVIRGSSAAVRKQEFVPQEWAPWSLLSAGAVVTLYSFTVPKRVKD